MQQRVWINTVPMYEKTYPLPRSLLALILLAAATLASSGDAATNGSNDWLQPARDALTVARQTLESFDPGTGNTKDLDPWIRVLG